MTSPEHERWRKAISLANVPTLLALLVQLTGEMRWLDGCYRPSRPRGLSDNESAGLGIDVQEEVRAAAADAVLAWHHGDMIAHELRQATARMAPMAVGTTVHDEWDGDDARAYLGTVVPDFPNFFCLYGPNTQLGHGGSLISVVERQMHYVMSVLALMRGADASSVEVRRDVSDIVRTRTDIR